MTGFYTEILYKSNGNSAISIAVQTIMELNFTCSFNNHYTIKMCKSKLQIFLTLTSSGSVILPVAQANTIFFVIDSFSLIPRPVLYKTKI